MPFPPVSLELLAALQSRFPERSPEPTEAHESLMVRAGQASVVRFLKAQHELQQEADLTASILPNVHP